MKKVIPVLKPVGKTPLEMVLSFKRKHKEFENKTISYAGRLDPMAEGVLLLLIGDENKKRNVYQDLEKEYEAEFIFGVTTDSFDAMGKINDIRLEKKVSKVEVVKTFPFFLRQKHQTYPPYSSKAVNGKPLFWWARKNKLSQMTIPKRNISIYAIYLLGYSKKDAATVSIKAISKIQKAKGDFRQEKIIDQWKRFGIEHKGKKLIAVRLRISCSSGTYIRRIASDMGEKLGCGAFALSIKRVRVGGFILEDCIRV